MDSYSIGISGLNAAQEALDVVGNNIANAATEGYHRQRIELTPGDMSQIGQLILGGGVEIAGVTRLLDNFLEQELLRQQSSLEQTSQELDTLRIVESAFGELSSDDGGLNAAIDKFFNALQDLSAHPGESIWQNQAVTAAKTMASQFRTLGDFLNSLETRIGLEADNSIEQVNTLISQIAELNNEIENIEMIGGRANNSRDQRDQCITELSKLIGVETQTREFGVVDVHIGAIPVVAGSLFTELEVGLDANNELGIAIADSSVYVTDMQGGRLGGLLSLKNELVSDIHDDMDDLAKVIVQQINQYHVQGVGSSGSFTELTGWPITDEDLADFDPAVSDGKIYIRVTNTSTGAITRNEIDIDVSTDSLTTIATDIKGITGLTASVVSSKLSISADANYKFDFLPGVLSEPTTSDLTPDVSISADMLTYLNADDGESNEIQTITTTDEPDGGSYTLSFGGETTGAIAHSADAAAIKSALVSGISTIDTDDIDVTGGPIGASTPIVITFQGALAAQDVGDITIDASNLTTGANPSAAPTVTEARQGHAASYTGAANQTYTCTVVGTGDVGVASSLQIEVEIGTTVVKTVSVGSGYAAGDRLDIGDGLFISIETGTLNDGEEFTIEALANSDTSGVLAAAGINTFFSGNNALSMAVCSDIANSPSRVATALGAEMTDNANAMRMTDLRDQAMSSLNSLTAGEFYRQLVTDVGQQLYIAQMRQDNTEIIVRNFTDQRSKISGVDINDEAAQMLVFEQMFRAMSKYLSTVQSVLSSIMEIL